MESKFINKIIILSFIAILFIIAFLILKSILISIIVGLLLAFIFNPVFMRINSKIKQKDIAAIILMLIITAVIAVPLWFIIPVFAKQVFEVYMFLQHANLAGLLKQVIPSLFTSEFATTLTININNFVNEFFNSMLNQFASFIVNIPNILLQGAVILFTFYFATRDSGKLATYASSLSPFSVSTEKKFLQEFRNITNTIIYGQLLIGIVQGIALGIGLFILGVPKVLVLTVITAIVSFIPILGSWLVWLPVGVIMIASGNTVSGIILLIYGALIVSSIDNLLRPVLISKNSGLPTSIALIGIIGGIYAFGIIGLVLGPLILSYVLIIIDFYRAGKLSELFRE